MTILSGRPRERPRGAQKMTPAPVAFSLTETCSCGVEVEWHAKERDGGGTTYLSDHRCETGPDAPL